MKAILVDLSKMEVGKRRVGAMSSWVSGTLEMADLPGLLFVVKLVMFVLYMCGEGDVGGPVRRVHDNRKNR